MLEICIDSLESALNAINGGADYIEVCSSLAQGGLTPTAGLLSVIKKLVSQYDELTTDPNLSILQNKKPKIKTNVMLRCRPGSDFIYTENDLLIMQHDLQILKSHKADGFVFGALTTQGEIDVHACRLIVEAAKPLPVTFHRAFDVCANPSKALETIVKLGFAKILTSGQQAVASDPKALELIRQLVQQANDRIIIMPGSGISDANIASVLQTGVKICHASCKRKKVLCGVESSVLMGDKSSEEIYETDETAVRNIVDILKRNKL